MKKMLTLLLVLALLLSTAANAYAADVTEDNEQAQVSESQIVTVGTLEELETAVAAAVDGNTIAISAEIPLDGVMLETDKKINLVRADSYSSGAFFRLKNGAKLSGFCLTEKAYSKLIITDSSAEKPVIIENCYFDGDTKCAGIFIDVYAGLFGSSVYIKGCTFEGAGNSAIISKSSVNLTLVGCSFSGNKTGSQGGAIRSSAITTLKDCTFTGNCALAGGAIFSDGTLTITNCQFSKNSIENEKFGTDIFSLSTLNITDTPQEGAGYYEESTGEKLSLPLANFEDTAKLIYLTDEDAKAYFSPAQEEPAPDDEPSIDLPNDAENEDTPDDPTIIYVPVYIRVPAEPETAEPDPVFVCGDAVIDVSRSVKLEGYKFETK